MQKKSLVLIILLSIAVLLAWLVIAETAANPAVRIISPASGTNYTNLSRGQTFLNVTFTNASGVTGPGAIATSINVTFIMNNTANGTSHWFAITGPIRSICAQIGATNTIACAANSTNVSVLIPDGTYTLNANISNSTGVGIIANLTNTTNTIKIDRTPPIATTSNFSSPFIATYNISSNPNGLITLNVSITDAVVGTQSVRVNFTNKSSGETNGTITLTREGTTDNFVASINTTHYMEWSYNITIYANDSLNNLNNSAVLSGVTFDSTLPSITFSCDDYTVEEDDEMDCDCSATDAFTGMNTSYGTGGVSFTDSPSTSTVEDNIPTTCTAQDLAGNVATSTRHYNVSDATSVSSGGGGGGGGGSSSSSSASSNSSSSASNSSTSQNESNSGGNLLNANQGNSATPAGEEKSSIWWILGVAIVAGVLVGAYFLLNKYGSKIPFLNPKAPKPPRSPR